MLRTSFFALQLSDPKIEAEGIVSSEVTRLPTGVSFKTNKKLLCSKSLTSEKDEAWQAVDPALVAPGLKPSRKKLVL